jgi:biotin carboxyl carrier protein
LIPASVLVGLALLRWTHSAWGPLRSDQAHLLVPSVPLVPAAQPVIAQEYGRLGRVFVREGTAVAPGEPLFSLQRDPQIDQELVDRAIARDLADVQEQMRDGRRAIDGLRERMAMLPVTPQPLLEQQILLARSRLLRREGLGRAGGVSRDLVDDAQARLLSLLQQRLERQQDLQRQAQLQALLQQQQQRLRSLTRLQVDLRRQDLQRREVARRHPALADDEQAHLDYATYRAPGRGVVLRLLKQPGDPVRPRETVAIWQREQPPPQVEALLPSQGAWLLTADQAARVEVPSLRQTYTARLLSWRPAGRDRLQARFHFEGLPDHEARRLLALAGEPVRLEFPRKLNLVRWLQTGQRSPSLQP